MHSNCSNYLGINYVFTIYFRNARVKYKILIGSLHRCNMKKIICIVSNTFVTQES